MCVWPRRAHAVLLVTILFGCSEGTGPKVEVRPELRILSVDAFISVLRDSGFIEVWALPADSFYRVRRDERVPFTLATSSGDMETLHLWKALCGPALSFGCEDLAIGIKSGHSAQELSALLETIPARFYHVGIFGDWAAVHVFGPERVARAIRLIGGHPAVLWVERSGVGTVASNAVFASALSVTVPLDFVSPVPSDGRVQARAGDRITLRYQQPGGAVLESVFQLP